MTNDKNDKKCFCYVTNSEALQMQEHCWMIDMRKKIILLFIDVF